MGEFAGKTALVTGAASGIGRATATALARAGAEVVASDLDERGIAELARALTGEGLRVRARRLDVADARAVEELIEEIERDAPIELLAQVAGVLHMGSLLSLEDAAFARTFEVNVSGVFYVARAVARRMLPRRRGALVTVGSNAARTPRAKMGAYPASKAAVAMLMKCLALELAPHGIRCNVVAPGSTDTPMQRALWQDDGARARVLAGVPEAYRVGVPLGRIAEADDIADAVLYLLSDRARHVTMHELVVDGGATLGC